MASCFNLDLYAADKVFYRGECLSLVIPTTSGQFGIMANHANVIAAVIPGELSFTTSDKEVHHVAVSSGMVKMENNHAMILVDSAEYPRDIDEQLAIQEQQEAKKQLAGKMTHNEYKYAKTTLARAVSKLKIRNMYQEK